MSLAQLVITAVKVEGRTKSDVARDYGITRFWVQTLVKRFDTERGGGVRTALAAAAQQPTRGRP